MLRDNIFVVCRDPDRVQWVRRELASEPWVRLCMVRELDDLRDLMTGQPAKTILLALDDDQDESDVSRALWIASQEERPIPVVVLSPRYDANLALLCFQMGATDYLGCEEHRQRLGFVLRLLSDRDRFGGILPRHRRIPTPSERFAALAD